MIIFIYKFWSINSGWLTLFVSSKVTRGDSFDFKMLLTISKSKVFNRYIVGLKKNSEIFNSFCADKSVIPSQVTLLTKNLLANCHFFKKDILQIIRNPDWKALGHDLISICMLKLCGNSICQSLETIFKTWF